MKKKIKNFDAVKMMRDIRDTLSERYTMHPEQEEKDLEKIRQKYHLSKQKSKRAFVHSS